VHAHPPRACWRVLLPEPILSAAQGADSTYSSDYVCEYHCEGLDGDSPTSGHPYHLLEPVSAARQASVETSFLHKTYQKAMRPIAEPFRFRHHEPEMFERLRRMKVTWPIYSTQAAAATAATTPLSFQYVPTLLCALLGGATHVVLSVAGSNAWLCCAGCLSGTNEGGVWRSCSGAVRML
jgi:hypothetical protein